MKGLPVRRKSGRRVYTGGLSKAKKSLMSWILSFVFIDLISGSFVAVPREVTLEDVANVKRRMVLMRADLLAEVVTVRSCFILTIVHYLFASPSITFYAHLSDLTVAY